MVDVKVMLVVASTEDDDDDKDEEKTEEEDDEAGADPDDEMEIVELKKDAGTVEIDGSDIHEGEAGGMIACEEDGDGSSVPLRSHLEMRWVRSVELAVTEVVGAEDTIETDEGNEAEMGCTKFTASPCSGRVMVASPGSGNTALILA